MNETKYREAEKRVWDQVGLTPAEQRVSLPCTSTSVRVQVVGDGEPVLFLHGGPNAGTTWATLAPHLPGFRCLLVDRPGTGLSDDYVMRGDVLGLADRFAIELLDGLGLERAHVVASSFGGFLALRAAAAHQGRFRRMVQMACPAMAPGMKTPAFMRAMRFGFVRWLIPKLPPTAKASEDIMRQIGHGASLDAGLIPLAFSDWYLDLQRHTNTMRNELTMIGGMLRGATFDPALTLDKTTLGNVKTPTLFLWGEDDGFGGADVAREVVGPMPDAKLEMVPRSGHLPWLDAPELIGQKTAAFLAAS